MGAMAWAWGSLLVVLAVMARIFWISPLNKKIRSRWNQPRKKEDKISTMVVLGSGGHTTEMSRLLSALSPERYSPLAFVTADNDSRSQKKIMTITTTRGMTPEDYSIHTVRRNREVGGSYVAAV